MTEATLEEPMADDKPKTLSVKLHMDVIESARIVTGYTGDSMTDLLSEILRPILVRMEKSEVAKREKEREKETKPTKKKGEK